MLAIGAALTAAIAWGIADFTGGILSRRIPTPIVLLGSSLAGFVVMGGVVLVRQVSAPPTDQILMACLGGAVGLVGIAALYRALAIGTMSIVAPVSSAGTAIPVVVGVAGGDPVTALSITGILLTISGVMLASREHAETSDYASTHLRTATFLALIAAASFGSLYVITERASRYDEVWSVFIAKTVGLAIVSVVILALWGRLTISVDDVDGSDDAQQLFAEAQAPTNSITVANIIPALGVGLLDTVAFTSYAYASTHGPLSVTAVITAMFPVVTVLLAHQILGERIDRSQKAGVACALTGVVLLSIS